MLPKGFILPNGKPCSVRTYVSSWKQLKAADPSEEIKGWEWYPVQVRHVLRCISDGVNDRVNQRGGVTVRELTEGRLARLKRRAKKFRSSVEFD